MEKYILESLGSIGWYPDRDVSGTVYKWDKILSPEGFVLHDAARDALSSFGGLESKKSVQGPDIFTTPFILDPSRAYGEIERFDFFYDDIGGSCYPLGEMSNGIFFISIKSDGSLYLLGEDIIKIGSNVADGLVSLITGMNMI